MQCLGASRTVTGAKFLLETAERRLLVDCGLYQGLKAPPPAELGQAAGRSRRIDAVALTHAHIDHIGYLPRLVKDGFRGPVTATRGTADLARILLPDSGHLQEEEARVPQPRRGRPSTRPPCRSTPRGGRAGGRAPCRAWTTGRRPAVARPFRRTFRRAGHILGSASVHLELQAETRLRRVVFSGDIGRYAAPILPDPEPIGRADYIFVESTYGDRLHDTTPIPEQLERVIRAAVERGGALVVPAFAVGRTQELLYHLRALEEAGASRSCRPTWTARWRSRRRASTASTRRTSIRTPPSP